MKICDTRKDFISYVASMGTKGYYYAQVHTIKEGKDLAKIDEKMRDLYYTDMTYTDRAKNRRHAISSHLYVRHGLTFALLATSGTGKIWESETLQNFNRSKLHVFRHTIKVVSKDGGKYRAHIEYEREAWESIKTKLLAQAIKPRDELKIKIASTLRVAQFLRFKGSIGQLDRLLVLIEKKRKAAKLKRL